MNLLELWIQDNNEEPENIMDVLQMHGVVSDNAVWPCDVADQDAEVAVRFLEEGT